MSIVRYRPNSECLFCDNPLTTKENVNRAFFTCGKECWDSLHRSLNLFTPEVNRRRGQNMFELAMMWWVLRNATSPIPHHQVRERMRNMFGEQQVFKDRLTSFSLKYFNSDSYTVSHTPKVMLYECKDLPFNKVLRKKYLDVITTLK